MTQSIGVTEKRYLRYVGISTQRVFSFSDHLESNPNDVVRW